MKLRFPACSAVAGKRVEQGLTILDMTHGSVATVNRQVYGLIKLASQVGSDYYPEILGNMLVVNAPYVFSGVWSVVKGFLDVRTRAKIRIIGGGYKTVLLEFIEDENIPSFLGGKCECLEHGGCMKSNAGPWNDYDIVKPKSVKKRVHSHPDVNGRYVFHDAQGKPILTVREPSKPIEASAVVIDGEFEECKDNKDDDVFFEAEDGHMTHKPTEENFKIVENIEQQIQQHHGDFAEQKK